MALQVWLPLNGDFSNHGLDNSGSFATSTSFATSGKIGSKSLLSNAQRTTTFNSLIGVSNFTLAYWIKIDSSINVQAWSDIVALTCHVGNNDAIIRGEFTNSNGHHQLLVGKDKTLGSNTYDYYTVLGGAASDSTDQWAHYTLVKDNTNVKVYVNGTLRQTSVNTSFETAPQYLTGTVQLGITTSTAAMINDVRIYDEALSPFEIKHIAQGLILYYPLNDNCIQQMDNCYNYPTFDTSSASGGWSHWGSSGHVGNYGQTTDKNYIYRSNQTYAHWVSDGSTATKNYLLYQSPAFEGGYRSLTVICKEEHGAEINESICYPAWNARNGGAISNKWTSITPLGNGFYLCKCEGISQSGSDDLVGIYICIGYKVYFSECYLENNRTMCSNFMYTDTIVYDCSGYCNNGIIMGTLNVSADTPRYNISTYFPNTTTTTTFDDKCWITAPFILNNINQLTVSFWFKKEAITRGGLFTTNVATYTGTDLTVDDYDNSVKIRASDGTSVTLGSYDNLITASTWCHWVVTFDGINVKVYVNSILKNTVSYSATKMLKNITNITLGANKAGGVHRTAKGNYSDFRIYATALSADDVKALYEDSAYISTDGTMYAYDFVES